MSTEDEDNKATDLNKVAFSLATKWFLIWVAFAVLVAGIEKSMEIDLFGLHIGITLAVFMAACGNSLQRGRELGRDS